MSISTAQVAQAARYTRRDAIAATALFGALSMPSVSTTAADVKTEASPFKEPEWRLADAQLVAVPVCKGERLTRQPDNLPTSKVIIDKEGVVFLNSVPHIVKHGISQPRRMALDGRLAPAPLPAGMRYSLPMLASGAVIQVQVAGKLVEVVATNGHVMQHAKSDIRREEFLDPLMDVSVVDKRLVIRNVLDTGVLPVGVLAQGVSDDTITSRVVSFCSRGRGHFRFTGKPFRADIAIPSHAPSEHRFPVFVMRVPAEMGDIRNELIGLSGSPVHLEGTREIVGVFAKCYPRHGVSLSRPDGSLSPIYLLFAGPDSLRAQVMACAAKAAQR